jgi:hypothetical protein
VPDRLIENLEAIRLFLAVPKTAFVIAADYRIVRHAVSVRFAAPRLSGEQTGDDEPYDLVTDYIEKLIQIPYNLPRLSPSEIETYTTMLFCQLHLKDNEQFNVVRSACDAARKKNFYTTFGAGPVRAALADAVPEELARRLQWTSTVAPAFSEGLKGNPRQVKRFLNALLLRSQLAQVAGLPIKDEVLVKLMLLEYSRPKLFDDLYVWQARAEGRPPELRELEDRARQVTGAAMSGTQDGDSPLSEGAANQWAAPVVQSWLKLDPPLADEDLRDYFWVARDRVRTTVSAITMVSPLVRRLFEGLTSTNPGERAATATSVVELDASEVGELFYLLEQQVQREKTGRLGIDGLVALVDAQIAGAGEVLLSSIGVIAAEDIEPDLAFVLQRLVKEAKISTDAPRALLERLAVTRTKIGAAAKTVLADLETRR